MLNQFTFDNCIIDRFQLNERVLQEAGSHRNPLYEY